MALCKRCKNAEAIEGKKNCVACAEYMRNYMKEMRAKKKLASSGASHVPFGSEVVKILKMPKVSMVLNENPEYSFDRDIDDSGTIFDVNNENVNKNKVNNVNNSGSGKSCSQVIFNFKEKKLEPEDLRYFYKVLTGRVFRKDSISCIKELIEILKSGL